MEQVCWWTGIDMKLVLGSSELCCRSKHPCSPR